MTILISFAVLLWLLICVAVVALARTAARGEAQAEPGECAPRFERQPDVRPSTHDRG